jgi:hypothetical protein
MASTAIVRRLREFIPIHFKQVRHHILQVQSPKRLTEASRNAIVGHGAIANVRAEALAT